MRIRTAVLLFAFALVGLIAAAALVFLRSKPGKSFLQMDQVGGTFF